MVKIDLHMHSNHSDGEFPPKELVDIVAKKKISVMAITDHDRATSNKEAGDYAKEKGIEYINGIEITATPPKGVRELHIVGLFINSENEEIKNISGRHKKYAIETAKNIIEKLNDLEYDISFEELLKETVIKLEKNTKSKPAPKSTSKPAPKPKATAKNTKK